MIKLLVIMILLHTAGLISKAQNTFPADVDSLKILFRNPPSDCWPHTRWWWFGNPVSREGITKELEQMKKQGIRGVEQITMGPVYEKGNIPYLSEEYFSMVKHTVEEATRLNMEVSFNFGGPGWIIGGEWVPEDERSKDMVPTSVVVEGPLEFSNPLPDQLTRTERSWEVYEPKLTGNENLLAVVAGRIMDNKIDKKSLTILTSYTSQNILKWSVPEGKWRIMAFWLKNNGISNAVDHFSEAAMQHYCEFLGVKYKLCAGKEFGKTVDSFFADSFELPNLASGIYWSTGLLEEFEKEYGYSLVPYLPAIWWEVDDISPKIRYDVNEFLHQKGMHAFFDTFLDYCEKNGLKGRIQPYGFSTDNIEAAGKTHIPEMEITAGEKDAMDWFDTRIGPKKYVASGAHIYGRPVISAEAYTFIHWERYRATLEELKIASDIYLKFGATKFYNHGFSYSPEKDVAPTRSSPFAAFINPQNVWWKYYPELAEYIARCSYLLRQGYFDPDIAVYSPLANQWTLSVLNARKWTREFDWGELGNLIMSNGYDFDLLNDDAMQNIAAIENRNIRIRNMFYKILILPNVKAIPLKTIEFVEKYVKSGGTVIALERIPVYSTGFVNHTQNDEKVRSITGRLFNEPRGNDDVAWKPYGKGQTYQIRQVLNRTIWWDRRSSTLDPFVNTIRKHIAPDFGIDFAREGLRKNEGITFQHRKIGDSDLYFVSNVQDKPADLPVTFRTKNKIIERWNPYDGNISGVFHFWPNGDGICLPLKLAPYESAFFIFHPGEPEQYVPKTDFHDIISPDGNRFSGIASANGIYNTTINLNGQETTESTNVEGIPAPFYISGDWQLTLEGKEFPKTEKKLNHLSSWTENDSTKHFSGTGNYKIIFEMPETYFCEGIFLLLDPGKVGNVAELIINGRKSGTIWMRGQTPEVTRFLKPGKNSLEILVTNTLINRISAMKEPTPVPGKLIPRFGSASSLTPGQFPREFGFKPLPASGLIGPVKIVAGKKIRMKL